MDNTIQELHKHIAFLERENKELGKSLKMLQSAPELVKDGDLKAAIEEFGKSVNFRMNSDVNRQKAAKMVHWLGKLAAYQDKTYITAEWLRNNGFEFRVGDKDDKDFYLFCDDVVEISAMLHNEEAGEWKVEVTFLDHGDVQSLDIFTLGQLRMFLAICGLDNIVNEFKE